jgi:hypothetical protein
MTTMGIFTGEVESIVVQEGEAGLGYVDGDVREDIG